MELRRDRGRNRGRAGVLARERNEERERGWPRSVRSRLSRFAGHQSIPRLRTLSPETRAVVCARAGGAELSAAAEHRIATMAAALEAGAPRFFADLRARERAARSGGAGGSAGRAQQPRPSPAAGCWGTVPGMATALNVVRAAGATRRGGTQLSSYASSVPSWLVDAARAGPEVLRQGLQALGIAPEDQPSYAQMVYDAARSFASGTANAAYNAVVGTPPSWTQRLTGALGGVAGSLGTLGSTLYGVGSSALGSLGSAAISALGGPIGWVALLGVGAAVGAVWARYARSPEASPLRTAKAMRDLAVEILGRIEGALVPLWDFVRVRVPNPAAQILGGQYGDAQVQELRREIAREAAELDALAKVAPTQEPSSAAATLTTLLAARTMADNMLNYAVQATLTLASGGPGMGVGAGAGAGIGGPLGQGGPVPRAFPGAYPSAFPGSFPPPASQGQGPASLSLSQQLQQLQQQQMPQALQLQQLQQQQALQQAQQQQQARLLLQSQSQAQPSLQQLQQLQLQQQAQQYGGLPGY